MNNSMSANNAGQSGPLSDNAFARGLRGFGPLGILAILIIFAAGQWIVAPLSAVLILVWVWLSKTPWRDIGYVRPKSWVGEAVAGVAFGIALKFLLKALVMPLLGAPAVNQTFHYLAGNPTRVLGFVAIVIGAGFAEETIFRGWLFERFGRIFGASVGAKVLIVLLTAGLFGAIHYADQNLAGVEQGVVVGLVFGAIFTITSSIWSLMWAHAAFDLTALVMIYYGVEFQIAHLVFK